MGLSIAATWDWGQGRRKRFNDYNSHVNMPKGGESGEPFRDMSYSQYLTEHTHFFRGE